jgi:serine/threonine-protein kinase
MGQVWLAALRGKHGFQKLFALKTIRPDHAAEPNFRAMFLDEVRIASQLSHPNVASVIELGEEAGILFYSMEYIEGFSLNEVLRVVEKNGDRLPAGIGLRICVDACAGLDAAHELRGRDGAPLQVVHRDVSPHNILVSMSGIAKVIDFGVAKARERLAPETTSALLRGKARYMAPEQVAGQSADRRADVWAVGIVAYRLLSGHTPFDGPNDMVVLHALLSQKRVPPLGASVPPPLADAVYALLERDPSKRPATAADARRLIEGAMTASRITTSHSDVAAYVAEVMRDRLAAQRAIVAAAIEGLTEPGVSVRPRAPSVTLDEFVPHVVEPAGVTPRTARGLGPSTPSPQVLESMRTPEAAPPSPRLTPKRAVALAGGVALAFVAGLTATVKSPSANAPTQRSGVEVAAAPAPERELVSEPSPSSSTVASTPPRSASASLPPAAPPTKPSTRSGGLKPRAGDTGGVPRDIDALTRGRQ